MRKREQGVLTIEASLVLSVILFLILFLFSFARVYRAQNLVGHATLQAADAVAMESYLRETALQSDVDDVVFLASHLTDSTSISAENLESLRSANLPKVAKQKFVAAIANSEALADEKLRKMGVKDGLDGVDFSECKMDLGNDDVIVAIRYTVEMQFPIFGGEEIEVTKSAKAKTFGEILFEVATEPNVPGWGSTSGDAKVQHGSTVQITATPNYGYVFVKWDDGVTDNPRTVTVTDAQHYVAIFEKDKFGINLSVNNVSYGSVSGAGNYDYMDAATISATPNEHYVFVGWDDDGDGEADNTDATRSITVDKTYAFKAIFKPMQYTVSVRVNDSKFGSAYVQQDSNKGTSIVADYGSTVRLVATTKDTTLYRFKHWDNGGTDVSQNIKVTGDREYVANFEYNTYTVKFYNGNTKLHETMVIRGSSITASKGYIGSSMPKNPTKSGASFAKWLVDGSTFSANTVVKKNVNVYAAWNYYITLNANGGSIEGAGSKTYTVFQNTNFNFSRTPSRGGWTFQGWYLNNTKYSGNKKINSSYTVTARWSCNHPYRVESGRTGAPCTGGTIYYKCGQCWADMGTAGYGGTGHNWSGRCDRRHKLNSFDGRVSGGCGEKHGNPAYSFCQACIYCSTLRSEYNWCASRHKYNSAVGKQRCVTGSHNYNKSWEQY